MTDRDRLALLIAEANTERSLYCQQTDCGACKYRSTRCGLLFVADYIIALGVTLNPEFRQQVIEANRYDRVERHTDCTVEILSNSVTGQISVGWWDNEKGAKDER